MSKFAEMGVIEDVNKSTYQYIKQRWGWKFFLPQILLILIAIIGVYINSDFAGKLFLLPLIWAVVVIAVASSKIREDFMRQFALKNNFIYMGGGDLNSVIGAFFKRGHSQEISYMVTGVLDGYDVNFFTFYYTVGSGDHKKTYDYAVCEIKTKGHAPDIIVESRGDWDFQNDAAGHQKEILIENAFREHFVVYAPEDFAIETLEIFTPDVLSELINRAKQYNFEFIEDRLYVFRCGEIGKRAELEEFLKFTDYLVDNVVPKVLRLSDDVRALKEARTRNEAR